MTEDEWLNCNDSQKMLEGLRGSGRTSQRKQRLLLAACCRRIWSLLTDKRSQRAVEVAERFADGEIGLEVLGAASAAAYRARAAQRESSRSTKAAYVAIETCRRDVPLRLEVALVEAVRAVTRDRYIWHNAQDKERANQAALLRDIVGNLFLPVLLDPAWRTPVVLSLAQAAYENRILPAGTLEPDRLAVLADALEDAGCTEGQLLTHLRGPGPHVRGCWALDLVLGKS